MQVRLLWNIWDNGYPYPPQHKKHRDKCEKIGLLVLRDFSHEKLLKLLQILLQENLQNDMIINMIGVISIYNNRWNWDKLKLEFQIRVPILRHMS